MQIMPATWAALRDRYGLGPDRFDVRDNVLAGAAYLRELHDRYGAPGFLAAYNAGPGRYEDHLLTGRALPAETIAYVAKLAPLIGTEWPAKAPVAVSDPLAWMRARLFPERGAAPADRGPVGAKAAPSANAVPPVGPVAAVKPARTGLFIPLSGASAR
jgi:hypothetical protein